jgi:hypothetical protein
MNNHKISERIDEIIVQFNSSSKFSISNIYGDGGACNPAPRLNRAAINQIEGEDGATLSRYAIWANTVRDNIIEAVELLKTDQDKSIELLITSANSLSAFSEIQAIFDPCNPEKNIRQENT